MINREEVSRVKLSQAGFNSTHHDRKSRLLEPHTVSCWCATNVHIGKLRPQIEITIIIKPIYNFKSMKAMLLFYKY